MSARVRASMKADRLHRQWERLDVEIVRLQRRQTALRERVLVAERECDALNRAHRRRARA
jgi:hypothetical protein